jgi:hypothetical protein
MHVLWAKCKVFLLLKKAVYALKYVGDVSFLLLQWWAHLSGVATVRHGAPYTHWLCMCVCMLGLILAFRYVPSDKGREFPSLPLVTRISRIFIYWPLLFAFFRCAPKAVGRIKFLCISLKYLNSVLHRTNNNLNDFVNNGSPCREMSQVAWRIIKIDKFYLKHFSMWWILHEKQEQFFSGSGIWCL